MKTMQKYLLIALMAIAVDQVVAQKKEGAVLFGLNQPLLLGGFNIELNYFTRKLAFDFSHGVSLNYKGDLVVGAMKDQHLVAHLPYSTGVGIGYRFTEWINLRVEPKWHRFEIYYDGDIQNAANRVVGYNTFTLGLGLYGKWHPFRKKENFLRGIMIAPSVRWWPNVATTLTNDQFIYTNKITGQSEIHQAQNIGSYNTPWFVNVSVGYRFSW
ncbi:hypothetical protein WSM22_22690 [Cytophagales bacterium WSM2-2]|nr:hypothetical protein WSM22_22690 [Cytophagales bacterium WSM2-2]